MPNLAEIIRNRILAEHPGALLIERGERHVRHLIETLPDGRQRFAIDSGPVMHYHDGSDWQEINTDWLDSAETGFVDTVQAAGFTAHSDANGRRRLYPRRGVAGEYVEFARIQAWNGSSFVNIPWASRTRSGNTITFDRANASLSIIHTGGGIKVNVTLKDASAAARLRWPVSLVGLHRVGWQLVSNADDTVVATIRPPVITHAGNVPLGIPRPVQCEVVNGAVEFTADLSGLSYPIVIDPDFVVAAGADDGRWCASPSFYSNDTSGMQIGYVNATYAQVPGWFRFPLTGPASGDVIDTAYLTLRCLTGATSALLKVYAIEEDNATAPTSAVDAEARDLTEAAIDWDSSWIAGNDYNSPEINTVLQEVVDRAGWASGNALVIVIKNDGGTAGPQVQTQEGSAELCGRLHVEYTAGGGAAVVLEGATAGTSTATASLSGATAPLVGTSTAAAATSAIRLESTKPVAGAVAASAAASATRLESTKPVSGSAAGTSATSGTLSNIAALAGQSTGAATVSATGLLSADALAGQSDGTSTATGALQSVDALSATVAGTSTATADLTISTPGAVPLSGQTDGTGAASGALGSVKPVAGASAGTSGVTGALDNTKALTVSVAGAATVSGALSVDRSLGGSVAGTSGVTANLQRALALTGSIAGASSVIGAIGVPKALTGQSDGAGAASGTLSVVALSLTELGTSMSAGNKLMSSGSLMRSVR